MNIKSMLSMAVAVMALALSGCNMMKGKGTAENAVVTFHEQLNKGDYEPIYSAADPDFKKASSKSEFLALLGAVNRKLGKVQSSNETNFSANTFNFDTKVTLVYKTKFDGGDAVETFVYRVSLDQVFLLSYNINSLAMMEK